MNEEHRRKIDIPFDHKLVQTDTKGGQRKGQDTDTYWYDEIDPTGNIIAKYIVNDSTAIYPQSRRSITWKKVF